MGFATAESFGPSIDGIDFDISQQFGTPLGQLTLQGNATYNLDFSQRITSGSPKQNLLNDVGQPVDLRLLASATLVTGGLTTSLRANYVHGYPNRFSSLQTDVGSWTTLDLFVSYDFDGHASPFAGTEVSLGIQNLLDREPPFVAVGGILGGTPQGLVAPYGFDPVNANALGRFFSLQISKKW